MQFYAEKYRRRDRGPPERSYCMGKEKMSFEYYYEQHYKQVYMYVYSKISNAQEAEDIAQDSFVSAYTKFENFDPERASFQTWIFVIVSNKLKNHYRDRKIAVYTDDDDEFLELSEEGFEDEMVEAEYLAEMRNELADALETLSEDEKDIIRCIYFENKTSKEAALMLGMSDVNVRVKMSRAIAKMRKYFEKNGIEWEM